eukprot:UC1_evm1s2125
MEAACVGEDQVCVPLTTCRMAFRLFELQAGAEAEGDVSALSPEVASTGMWFLRRWCGPYLLLDETAYKELSMPLLRQWGEDGEGVAETVAFLLQKITLGLYAWRAEPGVVRDTVALLQALSRGRRTRRLLLRAEALWSLASAFVDDESPLAGLPPDLQADIARTVCQTCAAAPSVEEQRAQLYRVLEPCSARTSQLLSLGNSLPSQCGAEPVVRAQLLRALHVLRGVVAATERSSAGIVAEFFGPHLAGLAALPGCMAADAEVSRVTLECFVDLAAEWLPQTSALGSSNGIGEEGIFQARQAVLEACYAAIESWSTVHGKETANGSAAAAAAAAGAGATTTDFIDGLCQIMELLHALTNDYDDYVEPEAGAATPESEGAVTPAKVVLFGLAVVLPLVTEDALRITRLRDKFFRVFDVLCDVLPDRIYEAPAPLVHALLALVDPALAGYGTAVGRNALCILQAVVAEHAKRLERGQGFPFYADVVQHFQSKMFEWFVLETFDMDLLRQASQVLFLLIICDQEHYLTLMQGLMQAHEGTENGTRLRDAFVRLTTDGNLELQNTRKNKATFSDNFGRFLMEVRGFLLNK